MDIASSLIARKGMVVREFVVKSEMETKTSIVPK